MVIIPILLIIGIGWLYYHYYHEKRFVKQSQQLREWVRHDRGGDVMVNDTIPQYRRDVLGGGDAHVAFDEVYGRRSSERGRASGNNRNSRHSAGNDPNGVNKATENPLRATSVLPLGSEKFRSTLTTSNAAVARESATVIDYDQASVSKGYNVMKVDDVRASTGSNRSSGSMSRLGTLQRSLSPRSLQQSIANALDMVANSIEQSRKK